jgi:hypothetical protein
MAVAASSIVPELSRRSRVEHATRVAAGPEPPATTTSALDDLANEPVLLARRAIRSFAATPLPAEAVAALLAAADAADALLWPHDRAAGLNLEALVLPRQVDGFDGRRLHRALLNGRGAVLRPDGEPIGDVREAVLQLELADAAAIITIVGSLADAVAADGCHGHRLLLSRGAAAAHAAWLRATELGLVGTLFAGFLPSFLRTHAAVDGYERLALLAFAVGAPARGT